MVTAIVFPASLIVPAIPARENAVIALDDDNGADAGVELFPPPPPQLAITISNTAANGIYIFFITVLPPKTISTENKRPLFSQ
jgi:hypothetical protein